jgi:hypothetical protein
VLVLAAESREAALRVRRSLDVDQRDDVEPAERGQRDTNNHKDCCDVRSGDVWWRGDPQDQPPPENPVWWV